MLTVKNKKVIEFYNKHNYIEFEQANILLVDMLEKFFQQTDANREDILLTSLKKISHDFGSLSNNLSDIKENVKQSSTSILNLHTTITNMPSAMSDNLTSKFTSLRENQVKELERIFTSNSESNIKTIDTKLKTELLDPIKNLFDTNMNIKLQNSLNQFEKNLKTEWQTTIKQVETTDDSTKIINAFNNNLQLKCDSLQNLIQSCHREVNDTTKSHSNMLKTVETHFERQKNSTHKGKDSEDRVEMGLNAVFPDCQINNTTGTAKAGDFLIERLDKSSIMIENKDYSKNVPKEEIDKFIRDIETLGMNGILISQTSGISRKSNYQIDIHDKKVIVYIHNLNYDFDKVRLAVEIIDHLSNTLKIHSDNSNELKLSADILDNINKEYLTFTVQKVALTDTVKRYNKDMTKIIGDLQFPELSTLLSQHFTSTQNTLFKCQYCEQKQFKSLVALTKHVQTCKKKHDKIKHSQSCVVINAIDSSDDD
jgi:hypothetical protein